MALYEYKGNLHAHTPYSDGTLYHAEVAQAAIRAGLDFLVTTDHNVWVQGVERYHVDARPLPPPPLQRIGYPPEPAPPVRRVLVLTGEEVHDRQRRPQANHCLVFGAECELAPYAASPQELLDQANAAGALTFLAHPFEKAAPAVGESALSWVDWDVQGYTGLEIWNYMSEFKSLLRFMPLGLQYVFNPATGIKGPFPAILARWDELLAEGRRVVGIGGADAHGTLYRAGPFSRVVFPYEDLFRAINTHVLTPRPLSGDVAQDKALIYEALRTGHAWTAYDLPAPTEGFRFTASGWRNEAIAGDAIPVGTSVTLQVRAPSNADIRLIRHGAVVAQAQNVTNLTYIASEPGAYRAELYVPFQGRLRGWIFSNPIYVLKG
jgi:hypothetical protein